MARTRISLDGEWQFWPDPDHSLTPAQLADLPGSPIQVPAPWQAAPAWRNYVGRGWYQREFEVPADLLAAGCLALGFGAADSQASIWLNHQLVGAHEGGYLPFELDVTPALRPGTNTLTVAIDDPLDQFPEVPHGKQSWYGLLSGLWQPVWLEWRPAHHVRFARVTTRGSRVEAAIGLNYPLGPGEGLRCEVLDPLGQVVARADGAEAHVELDVAEPLLWSPETPHLYTLRVSLAGDGADVFTTTFGFRTIAAENGRLLLNGLPVYLRGALDQDYYPDLIATPPSTEYIEAQFRQAKAMGLNCLRLHIKVGDPRYYDAADRLGLLIWTELPNWERLTPAAQQRARDTLTGMVERDWNHPSIIIWTLINESWGVDLSQAAHRAWLSEMYDYLKQLDPHRLTVGNSACWGNFQVVTDIEDFHYYCALPDTPEKWRKWVGSFAARPPWTFAHEYTDRASWRKFMANPWRPGPRPPAPEVRRRGDEPLIVSEFGNWGLPDVDQLLAGYGGQEPWWFETGLNWSDGVVYPHGIESRFKQYHLDRAFANLAEFTHSTQALQLAALKFQIEQLRLRPSLQGYVITEFTDVHWESNGLLDMLRNPKLAAQGLPPVNADDVIVPEWRRTAYWSGETCRLQLAVSHYSPADLAGSQLRWEVEGWPELAGTLGKASPEAYGVTPIGELAFRVPEVETPMRVRLRLSLVTRDGATAATNEHVIDCFPATPGAARGRSPGAIDTNTVVYTDRLAGPLQRLGYRVVTSPAEANLAIVTTLTEPLRDYLLGGGRVVWLAETTRANQTYVAGLSLKERKGSAWQGDWASTFTWVYGDRLFRRLPKRGVVDFGFEGLMPEVVLRGFRPHEFAHQVHAAMTVGWLHKTTALVAEVPVGRGRLMACTFRLSRHLATHPVAALMVHDMVGALER